MTPDGERLLLFIACALRDRRSFRFAVDHRCTFDVAALNDPALADHPQRNAALRMYDDARVAERNALQALMSSHAAIARAWRRMSPDARRRYGLDLLTGHDADSPDVIETLWSHLGRLQRLEPLPLGWHPDHTDPNVTGRLYRLDVGPVKIDPKELMRRGFDEGWVAAVAEPIDDAEARRLLTAGIPSW